MIVAAQLGFEEYGKKIQKWRAGLRQHEVTVGRFAFVTAFIKEYNDYSRVACLHDQRGVCIMKLLRAELIHANDDYFVVTGIEHDPIKGHFTAQTWCMEVLSAKEWPLQDSTEPVPGSRPAAGQLAP